METLFLIFIAIILTALFMQTIPNHLYDWVKHKRDELEKARDDDPNLESDANDIYEIFANEAEKLGQKGEDAIAVYFRTLVCIVSLRKKVGPIPKPKDFED